MEPERSDEALMLAYADGEAEAFEPLYARHRGPLFRFILRQVRTQATAEALFNEVWQSVIAGRDSGRAEARFATWLYRLTADRLTDHWRSATPRMRVIEADSETRDQALSVFEERRRLQRALESLPADQREAVVLRLEQELSLEAIGEITGAGRATVQSRLRHAMDTLNACLATGPTR